MLACQHCNSSLNQTGDVEFIVRCGNCSRFNRYRYENVKGEGKTVTDFFNNPILFKRQIGDGVLYTHMFDLRQAFLLRRKSIKSGEALEKFILYDKEKLSSSEKNLLLKLKSQSISEIEEKIEYLEAKKNCIEILKLLDF